MQFAGLEGSRVSEGYEGQDALISCEIDHLQTVAGTDATQHAVYMILYGLLR